MSGIHILNIKYIMQSGYQTIWARRLQSDHQQMGEIQNFHELVGCGWILLLMWLTINFKKTFQHPRSLGHQAPPVCHLLYDWCFIILEHLEKRENHPSLSCALL